MKSSSIFSVLDIIASPVSILFEIKRIHAAHPLYILYKTSEEKGSMFGEGVSPGLTYTSRFHSDHLQNFTRVLWYSFQFVINQRCYILHQANPQRARISRSSQPNQMVSFLDIRDFLIFRVDEFIKIDEFDEKLPVHIK